MATAGINSSDVEYDDDDGDAPTKSFRSAGKASLARMLDTAFEDRFASKKASKKLGYTNVNRKIQYSTDLWTTRVQYFREHVLGADMTKPPTGTELERFANTIVDKVDPRGGHRAPSYRWLKSGIETAIKGLLVVYDFSLTPHETSRIQSMTQALLKAGKLTNDPTRIKQWAGLVIVRAMVESYLIKALNEGTVCWDNILYRTASFVWMSALQCRVGDFMKGPLDDQPLPFLAWKDIELRFERGHEEHLSNLIARVTLRNVKGSKYDPGANVVRILRSCDQSTDNVLCPIKYLLILALRTGNVASTTLEDLLEEARQDPLKRVQWLRPDSPVFCAFANTSRLNLSSPAACNQMQDTIFAMSSEAGVLASLASHDVRRGGAYEIKNLKTTPMGISDDAAAVALGHSGISKLKGVTKAYTGDNLNDMWQLRRDDTPKREDTFGTQFATKGFRAKPLRPDEITAWIESEDLGSTTDSAVRQKAGYQLRKGQYDKFLAESRPALRPWSANTINATTKRKGSGEPEGVEKKRRQTSSNTPQGLPPQIDPGEEHQPVPIDPLLIKDASSITTVVSGGPVDPEDLDEGLDYALLQCTTNISLPNADMDLAFGKLQQSPNYFVTFFSRVNVIRNSELKSTASLEAFNGNSREPASRYMFRCKNAPGCPYKALASRAVDKHELICTGAPKVGTKVSTKTSEARAYTPRACAGGHKDCDTTYVFPTMREYETHRSKCHIATIAEFDPTPCTYPGCSLKKVFTTFASYRGHLIHVHKIAGNKTGLSLYLVYKSTNQPCPIPVKGICNEKKMWTPQGLSAHLRHKPHNLSSEQCRSVMAGTVANERIDIAQD